MSSPQPRLSLELFDTAAAIVGRTGSGKSYLSRGIVERMLEESRRVCVVDPTGAWWGLRRMANGKPGFDVVIFGGDHADVPITDKSGKALGALIAQGAVPACILDVSDMSNSEQIRFLTDFCEAVYQHNRAPLHLVLDEADVMAPQNPLPDQRRLQGAVNKIVRRGRIKGFRPLLITQRPQVIDKSVLSQANTLITMRLTSPQDRKAIEEWVKGNADAGQLNRVIGSLASLSAGEGWVWAPADDLLTRMKFPENKTHDSSKAPVIGDAEVEPFELKSLDLDALRDALAGSTDAPASKAGKPAKGKASSSDEIGFTAEQLNEAEKRGYEHGYRVGRAEAVEADVQKGIALGLNRARAALDALRVPEIAQTAKPAPEHSPRSTKGPIAITRPATGDLALNSSAKKLLAVLDTNPPVSRTWVQVATLAGLKARGGSFNTGKKLLIDSGRVTDENGLVRITKPSSDAAAASMTADELVDLWGKVLSGPAPKFLHELYRLGGAARRADIADNLGVKPQGGSWNTGWKELRDNQIVVVGSDDTARLTSLFQPDGGRA